MDEAVAADLQLRLISLFPAGVAVRVAASGSRAAPLSPDEAAAVARAVPARREEFAQGRACAKAALSQLGAPAVSIPQAADRTPIWPKGVLGSITHCAAFCAAAVARIGDVTSLGFDAEVAAAVSDDLRPIIARPDETEAYRGLGRPDVDWHAVAFSAKEALYKSYFVHTGAFLDFHDVRVKFEAHGVGGGDFRAQLLNPSKPRADLVEATLGRWLQVNGLIFCAAFTAPDHS
jgi:4'-phosphopantetheinyl transferase EntD